MTDPSWSQPPAAPPSPYPQYPIAQPGTYPGGYPMAVPMWEHPQGTTVLVLGILSFVVGLTAPFAWYYGTKAEKEIAAAGVPCSNAANVKIGRILGMVMTIVGAVGILATIAYIIFVFVVLAGAVGASY